MSGVVPRVIRRAGTSASSAFVSFEHKRRGNTRACDCSDKYGLSETGCSFCVSRKREKRRLETLRHSRVNYSFCRIETDSGANYGSVEKVFFRWSDSFRRRVVKRRGCDRKIETTLRKISCRERERDKGLLFREN